MYIADLHIHSKYSRATSRDGDAPHLDLWARRKGIGLLGTGDFTHPAWRAELTEMLEEAEEGLYRLRDEYRLPCETAGDTPRFVVSGEISTIYKRGGKTRKVHHVILLPGLEAAEASPSGWRPSAISIPTDGPFWGWTAATCWKSRWTAARRPSSFPPISGRRTFRSSGRFRIFPRWKNAMVTCPAISTRWKPAFPPTRP